MRKKWLQENENAKPNENLVVDYGQQKQHLKNRDHWCSEQSQKWSAYMLSGRW